MDFQNLRKSTFLETTYFYYEHWASTNLPWGHMRTHKKMGPIGSAAFTFIGYKKNLVFFNWKRTFFINSFLNYIKIQGNFIRETKIGVYFEKLIIFKFERGWGDFMSFFLVHSFLLYYTFLYTSETNDFRRGERGGTILQDNIYPSFINIL